MVLLREGARAIFGPDDPTGRSKWWDPLVHLYEQPLPITSATARSLYRPEMYWDDTRGVVLRTVSWRQSVDDSDKSDRARYRLGPLGLLEIEHRLLPIPFPAPLRSALRRLAAGASSYSVDDPCWTLRTADENPTQVLPRVGRRRPFHVRTLRTGNAWLRWNTRNQVELDQAWKRFWAILTRWESKTPIALGFRERFNRDPFRDDWVDLNFADRRIAATLKALADE
jgi:hypothetical protein